MGVGFEVLTALNGLNNPFTSFISPNAPEKPLRAIQCQMFGSTMQNYAPHLATRHVKTLYSFAEAVQEQRHHLTHSSNHCMKESQAEKVMATHSDYIEEINEDWLKFIAARLGEDWEFQYVKDQLTAVFVDTEKVQAADSNDPSDFAG